jgi:hypothetical protein
LKSTTLLAFVGYLLLVAFCACGILHLFYPSPPYSSGNIAGAAVICVSGIILMTLTHCIAFYLGVIATLDLRNPADLRKARQLWGDIFKVIPKGISLLKSAAKVAGRP